MEMELQTLQIMEGVRKHPCFNQETDDSVGKIYLPVASECNIQCKDCEGMSDCLHEGMAGRVLTTEEAVKGIRMMLDRGETITEVCIAGPGEPLANERTFEVLRAIKREFPDFVLSLSTNGLLLTDRLEDIVRTGVRNITITINAAIPEAAEKIYAWVRYQGVKYHGRAAADCLSFNQWRGLRNAIDAGLFVKVNTVHIPGVNDSEIPYIGWLAGRRGADVHEVQKWERDSVSFRVSNVNRSLKQLQTLRAE